MRLLILLCLMVLLLGCKTASQAQQENKLLHMKRTACYRECPVYEVTVYTDGTVKYEGEHYVPLEGTKTFRLNKQDFKKLRELIVKAEFPALKDEYATDNVTDFPTTFITYYGGKEKKEIMDYTGAPQSLTELENKLQEMVFSYLK